MRDATNVNVVRRSRVGVGVDEGVDDGMGVIYACVRVAFTRRWVYGGGTRAVVRVLVDFFSWRARADGCRRGASEANRARLFRPIAFAEDCFLGLVLEHDVVEDF